MDRELIQDYLGRAGMDASQADVLSRILDDMKKDLATKEDIAILRGEMAALKADLTWRMIAIVGFFGTVITLLNAFIG